jgi:hypothetical protein
MPLVFPRSWGKLTARGCILFNCFSEQLSLKILPVLSLGAEVASPQNPESHILSHGGRGGTH